MWDLLRRWPQQALIGTVCAYRLLLKPWLGSSCRFDPTCSAYTMLALQRHGALRGVALGGWRLLRCHPWCEGGCDAVPDAPLNPAAGFFTRRGPHPVVKAADDSSSTQNRP